MLKNIQNKKNFEFIVLEKDKKEIIIKSDVNNIIIINQNIKTNLKITIEENLEVEVLEIIETQDLHKQVKDLLEYDFTRDVTIKKNSKLIYNKIQILDETRQIEYKFNSFLKDNSCLNINIFDYGSKKALNSFISKLKNKNSKININALVKTKHKTQVSNLINIIHENEHTFSSLNFKHILNDFSKVHFEALSKVSKNALFSQAYQNSNTILLSNDATIFANPHLEIDTNELKASHGATTGSLDEEELFYLQQRGLSYEKATYILLQAIESEIYDKISNKKLKNLILDLYRTYDV